MLRERRQLILDLFLLRLLRLEDTSDALDLSQPMSIVIPQGHPLLVALIYCTLMLLYISADYQLIVQSALFLSQLLDLLLKLFLLVLAL